MNQMHCFLLYCYIYKSKLNQCFMKIFFFTLVIAGIFADGATAQTRTPGDSVMVTIFLKHQQDKNLDSLQAIQKKNKFDQLFPPKGSHVVSWYVMMGIGQVVTVKIAASQLRDLNTAIEKGAWGAFNTEFYATYDYIPIWKTSNGKP